MIKLEKQILKLLCVILSFIIVAVSITFMRRNKPVNQQILETETTAKETTTAEITTDVEKTTEIETTTEIITQTETTTAKLPLYIHTPISANSGELGKLLSEVAEKYGAVGIQVATIKDGMVSSTAEYGWATIDEKPIESDTKIRIASLSKTLVSMVTFKLIEEGKLNLDTDISEYLGVQVKHPDFPNIPITLRMLLTHTSGLADKGYQESLEKIQEHLQKPESYEEKPGEKYRYNNYGFGLVGTICECATGKSLNRLAKDYFFNPMSVDASYMGGQLNSDKVANIYNSKGEIGLAVEDIVDLKSDRTDPGKRMMLYSGGLISSASDFAKLLTLFVNGGMYGGVQFLSKESVELMQTPQLPNNSVQCMPMKKMAGLYNQDYMYYHTGSAYGVYSLYVYNPETKIGVVVITTGASNVRDRYGIYAVCGDIVDGIIKQNLL